MSADDDDDEARSAYTEHLGIVSSVLALEATSRTHAQLEIELFELTALYEPSVVELLHERGEDVDALRMRAEATTDALPRGATSAEPLEMSKGLEALFRSACAGMISEASRLSLGLVLQALRPATADDSVARALSAIGAEHVVRALVARIARSPVVTSAVRRDAGYRAGAEATLRAVVFDHDTVPMDLVIALFTEGWRLPPTEARMLMMRVHVLGSVEVVLANGPTADRDVRARTTALLAEWKTPLRVEWR